MITKQECSFLTCDNCEALFVNYNDFSIFADEQAMISDAKDSEWLVKDGKHYCPDCYYVGDNDEILLKPRPND